VTRITNEQQHKVIDMASFRETICSYMIESARAQQDVEMLRMLKGEMNPKNIENEIAKELANINLELKRINTKIDNVDEEIDELLCLMEEVKMLIKNKK